ncbi:MAG TPA: hypothetical protein VED66_04940, partial [Candidatus Sulfotelmatobacter sp.]|nr:hypothetical protein [Candidatus Sulfotelmatobacter sp.]
VVLFFALVGAENLIHGLGYIRYPWSAPGVMVDYYPGEMNILTGIVFLLVALGIFRFYSWARISAIVILGLWILVMAAVLIGTRTAVIVPVMVISALSLVLLWLFLPPVRARFRVGKSIQKIA